MDSLREAVELRGILSSLPVAAVTVVWMSFGERMDEAIDRRRDDPRIAKLQEDLDHLHACMENNTRITKESSEAIQQVRDILATFRVLGAIAKWLTGVGAAGVAAYHGWQKLTGR